MIIYLYYAHTFVCLLLRYFLCHCFVGGFLQDCIWPLYGSLVSLKGAELWAPVLSLGLEGFRMRARDY